MAATITVTKATTGRSVIGRGGYPLQDTLVVYKLVIAETNAGTTTEVEIDPDDPAGDDSQPALPRTGRILSQDFKLGAGDAETMSPVLGDETDPANGAWQVANLTAAARGHNMAAQPIPYSLADDDSWFHRGVYNTGSNNSGTTTYLIVEGVLPPEMGL